MSNLNWGAPARGEPSRRLLLAVRIGRNGDLFTTTQEGPDSSWKPWTELIDSLKTSVR
jgi:hypothetical protein